MTPVAEETHDGAKDQQDYHNDESQRGRDMLLLLDGDIILLDRLEAVGALHAEALFVSFKHIYTAVYYEWRLRSDREFGSAIAQLTPICFERTFRGWAVCCIAVSEIQVKGAS